MRSITDQPQRRNGAATSGWEEDAIHQREGNVTLMTFADRPGELSQMKRSVFLKQHLRRANDDEDDTLFSLRVRCAKLHNEVSLGQYVKGQEKMRLAHRHYPCQVTDVFGL